MEREVSFTMKEMTRYGVIQAVLEKKMTTVEAAAALHLSPKTDQTNQEEGPKAGPTRGAPWEQRKTASPCFSGCSPPKPIFPPGITY